MPTYAGIGSQDAPAEVLNVQFRLGKVLCDLGWHGISGEAPGPDIAYHDGARCSRRYHEVGFTAIIPWGGFQNIWHNPQRNIYDLRHTEHFKRSFWLGIGARGTDRNLKDGGLLLHSRDSMQVMGVDLKSPVKFVSCWAMPVGKNGKVKGGTNTAVSLALHMGIEVINLYTDEGMQRSIAFLEKHEETEAA